MRNYSTRIYPKLLKLLPETIDWLNQQDNPSRTIDLLVRNGRKSNEPCFSEKSTFEMAEVSALEEELEISGEQVKSLTQEVEELKQELNLEIQRTEDCRQELEYLEQELRNNFVYELRDQVGTAQMTRDKMDAIAQTILKDEKRKNSNLLVNYQGWVAVKNALKRFIKILLN
jgi:septal ring factor EnvC (AmiA/AmiB activator)